MHEIPGAPQRLQLSRRTLIKGVGIGAVGITAASALAACTGTTSGGTTKTAV